MAARAPGKGQTMSDRRPSTEQRLEFLERALAGAFETIERNRYEIAALKAALATLMDSIRPDSSAKSDEWFDAMLKVASENVELHTDLAADQIIADHGLDRDMLGAMEDEREAVTKFLKMFFAGLKRPVGDLG